MEKAGVVLVVREPVKIMEPLVDVLAVKKRLELAVLLNPSVLAHPEKNKAVDGLLDGKVQVSDGELRISEGQVSGKRFPPALDLVQERSVYLRGASFPFSRLGELIEGATHYGFLRKDGSYFLPPGDIIPIGQVEYAPCARLVVVLWLKTAVVDSKLLKIGKDAKGELGRPGVATQLEGRIDVFLQVNDGFFRFDEELAHSADAEAVVRCLGGTANLNGVLVDDVFIRLGVTLLVVYIPAQSFEKWIEEFTSKLGFVVLAATIGFEVAAETINQGYRFFRSL